MPRPSSPAADFPFGLRSREVRISIITWGLYITCQTAYCTIYERLMRASVDLQGMLIWAFNSWGIWILMTPLAFRGLRYCQAAPGKDLWSYGKLLAGILILTLMLRAGIDHVTSARGLVESPLLFLPRYIVALTATVLIWHFFLRQKPAPQTSAAAGGPAPEESYPETLLVSKGKDERLIRVDCIQHISAARNYVEIYCDHQPYLMRATMKQIEEQLPPSMFLRTHRSHIVNVNQIQRIKTLPSGNGTVHLRCGTTLGLSRKYRDQLQNYRLTST